MNIHLPATTPSRRTGVSPISLPVVLVLCFVTTAAVALYALVFLRTLLVNDKGSDLARIGGKVAHIEFMTVVKSVENFWLSNVRLPRRPSQPPVGMRHHARVDG